MLGLKMRRMTFFGLALWIIIGFFSPPHAQNDPTAPFNVTGSKYDLNQTMSINLKKSDIKDVLMMISELTGLNMMISPNLADTITANLDDVTVRAALDAILKPIGYSYFVQENIIIIKTTDNEMIGELETAVIKLKYISSNDLKGPLKSVLTSRGSLQPFSPIVSGSAEGGSGTASIIIISDVQENIPRVRKLIQELDTPILNINIAVRFIESQLDTSQGFGVDWSRTPIQIGASVDTSTFSLPINFNNLVVGTLSPAQLVNALKIMQAQGNSKLLSSPQVTTMDNHQAEVDVVTTVYIEGMTNQSNSQYTSLFGQSSTNSNPNFFNLNTVQEKDIGIKLQVIPRSNEGNRVTLIVNATVEALLGAADSKSDKPRSTKRTVRTQVTVDDGSTVIIGGLITENVIENIKFVPILSKIPYLGALFRSTSIEKEQRELLIFITPTIIR